MTPRVSAQGSMRALAVMTVIFSFVTSAHASQSDAPTSPYLRSVQLVGYWEDGKRNGFVRIAISGGGTEHYKNRAWLQWIEQKHDDKVEDVLAASTEIVEISDIGSFGLVSVSPKLANGVTIAGTHRYDQCEFRIRVGWTLPGRYSAKFLQSGTAKNDCEVRDGRIVGGRR